MVADLFVLTFLFVFIFLEIKKAIINDIDRDGLKSNRKYITYFALFTFIPSLLISIFSLFLFSFALEKYFDKKVTTVVNNSYELARDYVDEVRNKIQSEIIQVPVGRFYGESESYLQISFRSKNQLESFVMRGNWNFPYFEFR